MSKISGYPDAVPPAVDDFLLGTDVSDSLATKSFLLSDVITLFAGSGTFVTLESCVLPTYEDNAAAISGGLAVDSIYKTASGEVRIVV